MSYHYGVPPAHYQKFQDYSSPYSSAEYVHYVPAPYDTQTPTKRHSRKHSFAGSPRVGGYYSPAGSPPYYDDAYAYYTPRKEAYAQGYDEQQKTPPKKTRARASTGSEKTPPKHRSTPSQSAAPTATEKDAARAGIPSGYSIKNWDPTEKPIILLGSVFDANSLGKWIYDWTVFHHGASTPMSDMAGDLWLLLIKLAGKTKRAEECVRRVKDTDNREMIGDFLTSGNRLWEKVKQLLKDCEYFMMKAAKKAGSKTMGKNAGTEFVDSMFGRERYLEQTEKLMTSIRLWNMRFDVNCEDILRRPSAT